MPYLVYEQLADYCELPIEYLAEAGPDFCTAQIAIAESRVNDQLSKRYAVPFALANDTVKGWIASMVALKILTRRGIDPTDILWKTIQDAATIANDEIKQAAQSDTGRFDLPKANAARKPVIVGSSDHDPHAWIRRQAIKTREERGGY